MALHFTEFLQVKATGDLMFEKDLYKLSDILGRPAPEFRGVQVDAHDQGNLSRLIESSIRGNIKSPHSKMMAFTTMDANWNDGLCRSKIFSKKFLRYFLTNTLVTQPFPRLARTPLFFLLYPVYLRMVDT